MPKLQAKKPRTRKYVTYYVNIPKVLVESVLKWAPGDELVIEYIEYEGKKGVFIYKK